MSRVIVTERLQEGMILGHDLSTDSGQLLARQGQLVTGRLIALIRSFGIHEVEVTNEGQPEVSVDSEHIKQAREQIAPWFRSVDCAEPMMRELFRICVERRAHQNCGHPTHQEV